MLAAQGVLTLAWLWPDWLPMPADATTFPSISASYGDSVR